MAQSAVLEYTYSEGETVMARPNRATGSQTKRKAAAMTKQVGNRPRNARIGPQGTHDKTDKQFGSTCRGNFHDAYL